MRKWEMKSRYNPVLKYLNIPFYNLSIHLQKVEIIDIPRSAVNTSSQYVNNFFLFNFTNSVFGWDEFNVYLIFVDD